MLDLALTELFGQRPADPADPPGITEYAVKMTPPVVANGKLYIVTMSKKILVHGIQQ